MLNIDVKNVLNKINSNGYQAYVVGGAVRNYLLNKPIIDYDITTDALPEQIESMFEKTIPTGKKYGTITIVTDVAFYETTTFRSDGEYLDGRRPVSVAFSKDLYEDLKRRDFTMNSICVDANDNIIDSFDGVADIHKKIIRCIGNPIDRYNEDALRMLRAVRFMCQLNFNLEANTEKAINTNCELIKQVSVERIQNELNAILLSEKPSISIKKLVDTGLMNYIIPELLPCVGFEQHNPYHNKDVFLHIMAVLDSVEPKLNLRLAALFHDISKPDCYSVDANGRGHFYGHHIKSSEKSVEIMKRLKYSHELIEDVSILIRYHYLKEIDMKDKGVKKFISLVGVDRLEDMFSLNIADIKGKADTNNFEKVIVLKEKCKIILEKQEPIATKDLAIDGFDLEGLGIEKGKIYKELLTKALELVLEYPERNNKKCLLEYINNIKNNTK